MFFCEKATNIGFFVLKDVVLRKEFFRMKYIFSATLLSPLSILLLMTLFCFSPYLSAQNTDKSQEQEFVYLSEWRLGVKVHTEGYGLSLARSKIVNRRKKNILQFEVQEIKHPKQVRQISLQTDRSGNARYYFYGKQNYFYNVNVNYVKHRILAERGRKNGVEIGWMYGAGFSLGLLKPYYLLVQTDSSPSSGNLVDVRYDKDAIDSNFNQLFLTENRIFGSSGFLVGLNETSILPGIVLQSGFVFDWAGLGETIKAIEVGGMLNLYYKRVPLMVEADNSFVLMNLYARFVFGRKSLD